MAEQQITFADLQRLVEQQAPDFAVVLTAYLAQPDPTPEKPPAQGAFLAPAFLVALHSARNRRGKAQRRKDSRELWKRFLAQTDPPPPPRFGLADLLEQLYLTQTAWARATLVQIVYQCPFKLGLWGGLKRIYKLAEAANDAQLFGVLAWRFDQPPSHELSNATLIYLRRRAWRYLRELGASTPALYPQCAVEVLRHYEPNTYFEGVWIANHIWAHQTKKYTIRAWHYRLPQDLVKHRAYPDAWKRSADPLMNLLEGCRADAPARFAIQSLQKDFPEKLRSVTPAWLERLARRPLASVHDFLVDTLQGSPEFHQGKLKTLGLHETVLSLLLSPSPKARTYAIEYARANAADLAPLRLAELLEQGQNDTRAFAMTLLERHDPRSLGVELLGRLLNVQEASKWADNALSQRFERKEVTDAFLVELVYGSDKQRSWVQGYLKAKAQPGDNPADFWKRVLDDKRCPENYQAQYLAINALEKCKASDIGLDWLLDAVTRNEISWQIQNILRRADSLSGQNVEKLKGLALHPYYRAIALELMNKPKLVSPRELGLPWLLALARRADPQLNAFASRYLLEHMKPADFADAGGDKDSGIKRLFALALGEKEPEPVRQFAQKYLTVHHPVLGPEHAEGKAYGITPQVPRGAYTAERLWPALRDVRSDVRGFAVTIARAELRAWGYLPRVYELAESDAREVRNLCYNALLKADEAESDPACTLKPEELDAGWIFGMTESTKKSTRDVGMEMIRRHYARLGGPERLGWIMQSPDREVRQFAVRLLWEKHRPRELPRGWKPRAKGAVAPEDAGRFADVDALRDFLRRMLFGLPPGRSMEARDDRGPRRHVPASVAKRHVIEIVRDMGVDDHAFAHLVAPVLDEFTGSLARTEWQACLAALARLRAQHPDLKSSLPATH